MKNFQSRVLVEPSVLLLVAATFIFAANGFSQVAPPKASAGPDLELKKQIRIMGRLDPASKVALWRQNLIKQLETRTFTKGQRSVIKEAFELLTEDFYRADQASVRHEELDPRSPRAMLANAINANFSRQEADPVFYRIDPIILNAYISSQPILTQVKLVDESGSCDCLGSGGCCGMTCVDLGTCLPTQGCGIMGGQTCTGKCGDGVIT